MDFYIIATDTKASKIDHRRLRLMTPENTAQYGLIVSSEVAGFKDDILVLLSSISIAKVADVSTKRAQPSRLMVFLSKTVFRLINDALFCSGLLDIATQACEKMVTVAQAHAYGAFNQKIRELGLPLLPMEISPMDTFMDGFAELLALKRSGMPD